MHLEDVRTTLEVRQLHVDATVKAAGAQQRGIKGVRAVRCGEDDDTLARVEPVHLGEQLVQRLLALVVAAESVVAALADGIDLVNEHDAGRLLLRLGEEVAHLCRAHANEHLDEFRAGDAEERNVCFAGNRLGEQRLARARRAHEQRALGQLCADLRIAVGVV